MIQRKIDEPYKKNQIDELNDKIQELTNAMEMMKSTTSVT